MTQSQLSSKPAATTARRPAAKRARARVLPSLRALVALLIAVLQLSNALHFTLVQHSFSAALGGVVHVHGEAAARSEPRALGHAARAPSLVADALSCAVDLCPFADAPHGSLSCLASTVSAAAAFGAVCLLSEAEARSPNARRVFLSAPKTSPPV